MPLQGHHTLPGKVWSEAQGLCAAQFLLRCDEENHREDTHFLTHPQASPSHSTGVTMAQMSWRLKAELKRVKRFHYGEGEAERTSVLSNKSAPGAGLGFYSWT